MRLIDADELWERMYRYNDNEGAKMPYGDDDSLIHKDSACLLIENAPTIEPEIDKRKLILTITAGIAATNTQDVYSCGMRNGMRWCKTLLEDEPPKFEDASQYAQPDNRVAKIADLVEGSIDHFGLDDAMDLLYQIKGIIKNG